MARKHEAVEWLRKGYSPSRIADQMEISVASVKGYLFNQVGEGNIRRSDILFSIDRDVRELIESAIADLGNIPSKSEAGTSKDTRRVVQWLQRRGHDADEEEVDIYLMLHDARVSLGDMFEFIRDIELILHRHIREVLCSGYGSTEWWRKGIPENVRVQCAESREKDPDPASDPFCYTTFIHLKDIFDKQWGIFSKTLPSKFVSDKKQFLASLDRLNRIRNFVMHPAKGRVATEADFSFVREFRNNFPLEKKGRPKATIFVDPKWKSLLGDFSSGS